MCDVACGLFVFACVCLCVILCVLVWCSFLYVFVCVCLYVFVCLVVLGLVCLLVGRVCACLLLSYFVLMLRVHSDWLCSSVLM